MATTRIITINELIGYFRDFVDAHGQLIDVGYGPTSEIGVSRNMNFPYLWISHQSDSYINVQNKTAIPELKFLLLFMDQVNIQQNVDNVNGEESDNGLEVISDTFQMLQDCISYIETNWGQYGIKISESVRVFPAFDETQDNVHGS